MKKLTTTLVICFCYSLAFAQWTTVNPNAAQDFYSVHFPAVDTGYVAGFTNSIFKTTNGGITWDSIETGPYYSFSCLYFTTVDSGYGGERTRNGVVLRTIDGGLTWDTSHVGLNDINDVIVEISFPAKNVGYCVAGNGQVGKTTDGISWSAVNTVDRGYIISMHFPTTNTGYMAGGGGAVYKTTDGGVTWIAKNISTSYELHSIFFTSADTGFVVGYDAAGATSIYKTVDGGNNWTVMYNDVTGYALEDIYFPSSQVGYAVGRTSIILQTVDGGTNWAPQSAPYDTSLYAVHFVDENNGYTVGSNGTVFKTTTAGAACGTYCVWPGDANSDGIANNMDVLNIGIAYGFADSARADTSIAWVAQSAPDWSWQFADSTNYKHADCNGDGVVNDTDTLAVYVNYGKTHPKDQSSSGSCTGKPKLYFEFTQDSVQAGEATNVLIKLGDDNLPASGVYGAAFTVNYDPAFVDSGSVRLQYSTSELTNAPVSISKDFWLSGAADGAVCRTNQTDTTVSGTIANAILVMEEDLTMKDGIEAASFKLSFSNVKVISANGTEIEVCPVSDSIVVWQYVGINEPDVSRVKIFPNPAKDQLNIATGGTQIEKIIIRDVMGNMVAQQKINSNANIAFLTSEWAAGMYFISLETPESTIHKKVLISR